jgi:hypothetical protein
MKMGCCLGSEGNGVSMGGGGEGGPELPEMGKDKKSMPSKGGNNMEKDEKEQSNRAWWRRIGANRVSSQLIKLNFYKHDWASWFWLLFSSLSGE